MFQIVFPMEIAITLMYWCFLYSHGSMYWGSVSKYVHPILLYIIPAVMLILEWLINSIMFVYNRIVIIMMIYIVYVPMTYIGYFALGYYPYSIITWDNWYSFEVLIALGILQIVCFFAIALSNNYFKRRLLEKQ